MPVLFQITLGTFLLLICALLHIAITSRTIRWLSNAPIPKMQLGPQKNFILTAGVLAVFLVSHTLHLYIWAFSIWALGALNGYEDSIYFSLVTYTTVGYGDVTLPEEFRIFGAMASVTGILLFGFTTAFLVGFFTRLLTEESEDG